MTAKVQAHQWKTALRVGAVIAALVCIVPATASAEQFEAKVIGVADGDTVTVLFVDGITKVPRRIRLSGIDAPEKAQAFGTVAREALSRLAFAKLAVLDCRTADRYGRSVCLVKVDGLDVGLRMVELGLAWHYKQYARTQPREEAASYAVAESVARESRTGLWRDLDTAVEPMPPWEWRKAITVGMTPR